MQGASSSKSYPPSSSETPPWKYDVFVSFHGEDARKSFADHLFAAMERKGIISFRDDETLERGRPISQELFRAIEDSRFSVVIFSRNYATSTWCLDEVAKIAECMKVMGQTVLPVFYHVDPSDVRKQKGSFCDAFAKHQEDFKENAGKVEKWRDALADVANLSGWDLGERRESEVIQAIVEKIFSQACCTFSSTAKNIVGIDSQVKEVISYLDLDMNGTVQIVGICGMGGIGKTTLAEVVFDKISNQFEGCSFLTSIGETCGQSGQKALKIQLLSEILMDNSEKLWTARGGTNKIKSHLSHKKILLVLDDVARLDQLKMLAGERDWFGLGSRIIITTRDEHLLITYGVDKIFKHKGMNYHEAHQLFCLKAFKRRLPLDGYMELSNKFVNYTNGLPLALEVVGSFLFHRSIEEWESTLNRLKEFPNREMLDVLRISYDRLEETEKKIFLDIACFFRGEEKDRVVAIFDSCGFNPVIGIKVLIDKSLITVSDNKLWMHDMLQEMGRGIVYQECPEQPCRRSRLWHREDIEQLLVKDKGMDAVEVIIFDDQSEAFCIDESIFRLNSYIRGGILCSPKAFSSMSKLRLLKVSGGLHLPQSLEYLSKELRFFEWFCYPLKDLPTSFPPNKIVEISICCSKIESLWTGIKVLEKLKFINLKDSHNLIKTPDFTGVPNLERLVLENCKNLVEVHPSIGCLKKLTLLNLKCCFRLRNLPRKIEMESLEVLILSSCSQVQVLPEFGVTMKHLSELRLDRTGIRELPLTLIKNLTGLHLLDLSWCTNLIRLPMEICGMTSLKKLELEWCSELQELPENMGDMECLEELNVCGTAIQKLPSSISLLKNLKVLSFCGSEDLKKVSSFPGLNEESAPTPWYRRLTFRRIQRKEKPTALLLPSLSSLSSLRELNLSNCNLLDGSIPSDVGSLSSLTKLNLSGNNFSSLPESISQLSKLTILDLESCRRLRSLPELPLNIQYMKVQDCTSLEASSDLLKLGNLSEPTISCINCFELVRNKSCQQVLHEMFKRYIQGLSYLRSRFDIIVPGSQIPKWFNQRCAGDRVVVQLPRDFREAKLVGFALCTVFVIKEHLRLMLEASQGFFGPSTHQLGCHIKINGHSSSRTPIFWFKEELDNIGSQHLWLLYLSRHYFGSTWQNNCNHIEFSFEVDGRGIEVVQSGACVVYEEDVENFHRPMSTLSGSSDIKIS